MNERIKELAEQAEVWVTNQRCEIDSDIFAKLIVRKCAEIIESQDVDPSFKLRMSLAVKNYFGVE